VPVSALAAGASTASEVEPGLLGFLVVAGLAVALYFLIRSMNKQLRKVGADKRTFVDGPDQEQLTNQENVPDGSRQDR
jgi:hypothetical protein